MKEPTNKRDLLAEQAKRILDGKEEWKPTWKALGLNYDRPLVDKMAQSTQLRSSEKSDRTPKQ